MTTRALITLTTDFGLTDPFVGVMKGVIASICPAARVIDITHGVKAFDVLDGALAIWQARRYFPAETVHTIVVDPGVGSSRHPVLCRMGNAWFIAPDNGVLTLIEREERRNGGIVSHRSIENQQYMLPDAKQYLPRSRYFCASGRASWRRRSNAAIMCSRKPLAHEIESLIQLNVPEPNHNRDGSIEGVILKSDRFGNLLTNLPSEDVPADRAKLSIELGTLRINRFCRYYAEVPEGRTVRDRRQLRLAGNRREPWFCEGSNANCAWHAIPLDNKMNGRF